MCFLLSSLQIYITCYLQAVPLSKKEPEKKACSFIAGRSVFGKIGSFLKNLCNAKHIWFVFRWRSADGDNHACESCDRAAETAESSSAGFIQERVQGSKREHRLNGVTFILQYMGVICPWFRPEHGSATVEQQIMTEMLFYFRATQRDNFGSTHISSRGRLRQRDMIL